MTMMPNERSYVSPDMFKALEEQTRALASALGIALPEEFSLAQTRLVMANAVPRTIPLGGARVAGDSSPGVAPPIPAVPGGMTTPDIDAIRVKVRSGLTDGRMFPITPADLVKGNVLCSLDQEGGTPAFSDCVIVDVYETNGTGDKITSLDKANGARTVYTMVRLARPYIYVSNAETACPTVLQGFEDYSVLADSLIDRDSRYRVRCQSTGQADRRVT